MSGIPPTAIPWPTSPPARWGLLIAMVIVPSLVPGFALLLAPSDVFDRAPALRHFVDWMGAYVPRLSVHADSTNFPQAAFLVDSLVVASSAWIAFAVLVMSTINYRYLLHRHMQTERGNPGIYLVGFLGIPIGVGTLAALVMLPGDPSWAQGATTNRTLFYLFLATTKPWFAGSSAGMQLAGFRLYLDAHLFSRPVTTRALHAESSVGRHRPEMRSRAD